MSEEKPGPVPIQSDFLSVPHSLPLLILSFYFSLVCGILTKLLKQLPKSVLQSLSMHQVDLCVCVCVAFFLDSTLILHFVTFFCDA